MQGSGTPDGIGVNLRMLESIFHMVNRRNSNPLSPSKYTVELSMIEIYNENIIDLLALDNGDAKNDSIKTSSSRKDRFVSEKRTKSSTKERNAKLEVTMSSTDSGPRVIVRGLTSRLVGSPLEANKLFNQGMKSRAVAATDVHEHSSRSHCIVRVDVRGEPRDSSSKLDDNISENINPVAGAKETTLGRLYLVDLAGSERVNKSGVEGKRLVEAKNINRSLSALGDVIEALDKKRGHVPYRNSTLTRVLQDALCKRSVVAVVVTICPTEYTADESLCSLHFAQRLRRIEMGVAQRKITVRNNAVEAKTLRSKLSSLVAWRKKAIVELEELRGKARQIAEEHGKKEVQIERAMQNLRNDSEACVEIEKRRNHILESKLKKEHDLLLASEKRIEASERIVEQEKALNKGMFAVMYILLARFYVV
eukprot:g1831.t1